MKTYIKGFDENLCCRGMQFKVGETYEIENEENRELELCSNTVFHFCKTLQQVHEHYSASNESKNRFCEVEVLGKLIEDTEKCGSNKIRIVSEIKGKKLNDLRCLVNGNTGLFNSGYFNSGDCNTGNRNTGNRNSGDCNTGNRNTGYFNSGDCNTGNRNTGYFNSGDCNTGNFNSGDHNTGLFNTNNQTIYIFNEDSGLTYNQLLEEQWFKLLFNYQLELTEWVWYTNEEMENSPIRQCTQGYLKTISFKDACVIWWNNYSDEEKKIIQTMPNFNKELFREITSIEI